MAEEAMPPGSHLVRVPVDALAIGLVACLGGTACLVSSVAGPATFNSAFVSMAIAVPSVLLLAFGFRCLRVGVWVGTDELRIRNVFRSYRVPRHAVQRLGSTKSFGSWRACVVLDDDTVIPMRALEGGVRGTTVPQQSRDAAQERMDLLAAALDVPQTFP